MKRLLFSALLVTGFTMASYAQQGSILVFGNVSADFSKQPSDYKTSSFNINPGVGYQFTDNWTAGVMAGYGVTTSQPSGGSKSKNTNYSVGAFGRYSYPLGGIFSLYGQGEVTNFGSKAAGGAKTNGFNIDIYPAIALHVKDGFALNFGFGGINYNTSKLKGSSGSYSEFGINLGEQFNIGVSKNFGGK